MSTWFEIEPPRPYDWMRDYGLRLTFALQEREDRLALLRERRIEVIGGALVEVEEQGAEA